jgi:hypothetical protein
VECAGYVGGRERDDELPGLGRPGRSRLEEAALLPPLVPRRLDCLGVVCLEMGVLKRLNDLLLASRGFVLVRREGRCLSLGRLRGDLGSSFLLRLLLLQLSLLCRELGRFISFGLLLLF